MGLLSWLSYTGDSSGLTRTTFITAFLLVFTYRNLYCSMVLLYDHQVVHGFLSSPLKPDTPATGQRCQRECTATDALRSPRWSLPPLYCGSRALPVVTVQVSPTMPMSWGLTSSVLGFSIMDKVTTEPPQCDSHGRFPLHQHALLPQLCPQKWHWHSRRGRLLLAAASPQHDDHLPKVHASRLRPGSHG